MPGDQTLRPAGTGRNQARLVAGEGTSAGSAAGSRKKERGQRPSTDGLNVVAGGGLAEKNESRGTSNCRGSQAAIEPIGGQAGEGGVVSQGRGMT